MLGSTFFRKGDAGGANRLVDTVTGITGVTAWLKRGCWYACHSPVSVNKNGHLLQIQIALRGGRWGKDSP